MKSENRIQINGVWYVREDQPSKPDIQWQDPSHSESLVWENDEFCLEVNRLLPEVKTDGCWIKFTDKRGGRNAWKEEYWDNDAWMKGIYQRNPESLETLNDDVVTPTGREYVLTIIDYLANIKWIRI